MLVVLVFENTSFPSFKYLLLFNTQRLELVFISCVAVVYLCLAVGV